MTLSIQELENRILVLERKVAREKKARNSAENQLEKYSLDIYEANQSLKIALASSTQKQLELEYLANTSSNVASEATLNEMIKHTIQSTVQFCDSRYGLFIITEQNKEVIDEVNQIWEKQLGWHENTALKELIIHHLPLSKTKAKSETNILSSWKTLILEPQKVYMGSEFNLILYTNFPLASNKIGWIVFLNNSDKCSQCDKSRHSALNTARENLLAGVHRRLTDIRMLKRNKELQNSLSALKNTRQQLIQSGKMASLGQLAAGVAHEINNPIAFIRSNMEVFQDYIDDYKALNAEIKTNLAEKGDLKEASFKALSEKFDLPYIEEDAEDLLRSNIEGLDRVKEIVDNLKGFSHSGNETLAEMSLHKCVLSSLQVVANIFKYKHRIENNLSEACPAILGNSGQLQQVFVNLFVNAAYAMENGGTLTINYQQKNEHVIIQVKDTGSGMDSETVSKLFTPFFTTKPVGTGTGLGLSISYSILEVHGAQISVDSTLNVGTTFNIIFPLIN